MSQELQSNPSPQLTPAPDPSGSAVPYILCFAVLIGILFGGFKWWQYERWKAAKSNAIPAGVIGPPLTEFELAERSGKPFRSLDMRGRVWVASYFFTTCPGQCIRLNSNIQVMSKMPDLKDVTWVSITCDPDNDTLEALRAYADRLQADPDRWLFCRADLEYVQRVAKGMKVAPSFKGHQDYAIVIDKQGKIRGMFDATSESQCKRLKNLLLECLDEKPPHDLAAGGWRGVRDAPVTSDTGASLRSAPATREVTKEKSS